MEYVLIKNTPYKQTHIPTTVNIAKGTTGPRVEFILQVLRKINAPIESPVVDAVAEQKTAR